MASRGPETLKLSRKELAPAAACLLSSVVTNYPLTAQGRPDQDNL